MKRIFTGWMFASSPGLHAVEHPIYDLWLTDCKGGTKTVAAESAPETPPRAQQPQQKRAQQPKSAGRNSSRAPQVQQHRRSRNSRSSGSRRLRFRSPSPNSYPVFRC